MKVATPEVETLFDAVSKKPLKKKGAIHLKFENLKWKL